MFQISAAIARKNKEYIIFDFRLLMNGVQLLIQSWVSTNSQREPRQMEFDGPAPMKIDLVLFVQRIVRWACNTFLQYFIGHHERVYLFSLYLGWELIGLSLESSSFSSLHSNHQVNLNFVDSWKFECFQAGHFSW